jgi:hypothetical protein
MRRLRWSFAARARQIQVGEAMSGAALLAIFFAAHGVAGAVAYGLSPRSDCR